MSKKQINIQMDRELYDFIVVQSMISSFVENKTVTVSEIVREAIKKTYNFGKIKYDVKLDANGVVIGCSAALESETE